MNIIVIMVGCMQKAISLPAEFMGVAVSDSCPGFSHSLYLHTAYSFLNAMICTRAYSIKKAIILADLNCLSVFF
jgi:hypothetical protein